MAHSDLAARLRSAVMAEAFARVGDIDICYEAFGDPGNPAMLLIMGLGTQMIAYHSEFCAQLADRGFFVIRHDNRDIGRSTHLDGRPVPSLVQLAKRDRNAPYTLADMADDSVGVLDALGIEKAHVVGTSMGGMIAQTVAIRHPDRVLSLVSIMSNTGARRTGQPSVRLYGTLLKSAPRDREGYIAHQMDVFAKIGSPGFPRDDDDLRHTFARAFERGHDPAGSGRQLAATRAASDRTEQLGAIRVPTLVIHGTEDRLVNPSGGRATAKAIPGARLLMVEGMGHDLPRGAWPQIIDAIAENAARAGAPAAA